MSARHRLFDRIAALTNNLNGFAHGVEQFEMAGHALCRPTCVRLFQPMTPLLVLVRLRVCKGNRLSEVAIRLL